MIKRALIVFVIGLFIQGCSTANDDTQTETNDSAVYNNSDRLEGLDGPKVAPVSDDAAENNLGVPTDTYDYQIVVKSDSNFSLLDEEEEAEDEEAEDEEKEKKKEDADDEDDDEAEDDDDDEEEAEDEDDDDKEDKAAKEKELKACSEHFGADVSGVKMAGAGQSLDLEPSDIVAVRITGSENTANLLLTAEEGSEERPTFKGLCFILSGNMNGVNVVINGVEVADVYMVGRGNGSYANIEVKEGGAITGIEADIKGNSAGMKLSGDGEYPEVPANVKDHGDKEDDDDDDDDEKEDDDDDEEEEDDDDDDEEEEEEEEEED